MLGILGGMGPLASAEFLKTIYECAPAAVEQDLPACILLSDPTLPDRSEAIRTGIASSLAPRLALSLDRLLMCGADRLVIACVTCHHFLPHLPGRLRKRIISVVDLIFSDIEARKAPFLMLCTNGTRQARLFENHAKWNSLSKYMVLPSNDDQRTVHSLIYTELKRNHDLDNTADAVAALVKKYALPGVIAGCTDLHLLTRHVSRSSLGCDWSIIDPLVSIATNTRGLTL